MQDDNNNSKEKRPPPPPPLLPVLKRAAASRADDRCEQLSDRLRIDLIVPVCSGLEN